MPLVKRTIVCICLLAGLALACGTEDEGPDQILNPGGAGGDPGPQPPEFDGIAEVFWDASQGSARVEWQPATDAETPAKEITYTVLTWEDHPDLGGEPRRFDWPGDPTACVPACRYRLSTLVAANVTWVAVEARDGDGMTAGADKVLPVVASTSEPEIRSVTPTEAIVGVTEVQVDGMNFFDERTSAEGLLVNGKPVDPDGEGFVLQWTTNRIRFVVHAGLESGPIEVRTLVGSATADETLEIQQ